MYIPGDNDVGGEGFDPREEWKVNRFRKFFSATSSQVVSVKFVDFIKVQICSKKTAKFCVTAW